MTYNRTYPLSNGRFDIFERQPVAPGLYRVVMEVGVMLVSLFLNWDGKCWIGVEGFQKKHKQDNPKFYWVPKEGE